MGLISLRNSRFPGPTYDGLDFRTFRHHIDRYSSLPGKRSPSITLRTSFKCSAVGVPLRNRTSSTTRARHNAWHACAALSFIRLFASCARKSCSQSASTPRTASRTVFAGSPSKRHDVSQKGFDALIHTVRALQGATVVLIAVIRAVYTARIRLARSS